LRFSTKARDARLAGRDKRASERPLLSPQVSYAILKRGLGLFASGGVALTGSDPTTRNRTARSNRFSPTGITFFSTSTWFAIPANAAWRLVKYSGSKTARSSSTGIAFQPIPETAKNSYTMFQGVTARGQTRRAVPLKRRGAERLQHPGILTILRRTVIFKQCRERVSKNRSLLQL